MLIQPFIENAIRYGLLHKTDGNKEILVSFNQRDVFECVIEDNGIGRRAAQKIKMSKSKMFPGITAINTKKRIEILVNSGYTETKYYFEDLYDENKNAQGTRSILILPLKNEYDKNS